MVCWLRSGEAKGCCERSPRWTIALIEYRMIGWMFESVHPRRRYVRYMLRNRFAITWEQLWEPSGLCLLGAPIGHYDTVTTIDDCPYTEYNVFVIFHQDSKSQAISASLPNSAALPRSLERCRPLSPAIDPLVRLGTRISPQTLSSKSNVEYQ